MVIIENLRKEITRGQKHPKKRRFVSDNMRDGAVICYPVYDRNLARIVLIISLYTDMVNGFKEAERKKYEYVLDQFSKRMLVEYNHLLVEHMNV